MNSPDVAAALYAGAPDAAGKLYDAHAEALFQYCWLTLRDRWQAKTAVCDALVQAGARVAELSDPATLRAWLFALVRAECHHHPLPSLGDTDEPIARPEQPDATLRIMAWNSVMSLDLVQRQALDLATRHGMTEAEISLILGLPCPAPPSCWPPPGPTWNGPPPPRPRAVPTPWLAASRLVRAAGPAPVAEGPRPPAGP